MYSPTTPPSTLAEMRDFLLPMVDTGFFDSVEYDDPDTPTKLVCTQDANVIVEFTVSAAGKWNVTPHVAAGDTPDSNHRVTNSEFAIQKAYRCTGGALIVFSRTGYQNRIYFAIGHTTATLETVGVKTAFVLEWRTDDYALPVGGYEYFTICYGDDTNHRYYTTGYYLYTQGVADRTILREVPIIGSAGSTDGFSSIFVRDTAQYAETGEQIISGTKYFCCGHFAILDADA